MREHCTTKMHKCYCMKFLCIISGCPAGAKKWHITCFAMLLHSKKKCHSEANVTKLAPSEKVKIGTRTAHSATEQRLCAVFLKKGMTRKRIEKSAKKSYSKRINYATL